MGICISIPIRAGRIISKRVILDTKHNRSSQKLKLPNLLESVLESPKGTDFFEKYQLGRELGRGEFGITYQCFCIQSGKTYACKTISKEKLKTAVDVEDVRREVEIMKHLPKHPNIVSFKEAFEDKDAVRVVMELCEGGELFDRIVARGHYTERAAAIVTKTIVGIVKVCHEQGVMHRDLKPENFLFSDASETSQLKAIDFGLSIFFEPGQRFREIVGSPYYMAPEVLRRNYGPEIDIWSAGVILYILLCGVPPFWAETEEGIANAIMHGELDFSRDPWPQVSEDAKNLVLHMLDPNPNSRLNAQEVLANPWIQNAKNAPDVSLDHVRSRIMQFSMMNKFKKRVLRVVADNLPNEQADGIKEVFNMMDTDNDGDLSFEELKDGLVKIGHPVPDPDLHILMDAADADGNGTIDYEEFITMSVHMKRIGSDEQLSQAFSFFDKNQSGYIEMDELKEVLFEDNHCLNNEKFINDIIVDVDLDRDGRISYDEFRKMMESGADWKMASRQYSRAILKALSMNMFKDNKFENGGRSFLEVN